MDKAELILVINLGSTSTKLALFRGDRPVVVEEVPFKTSLPPGKQLEERKTQVRNFMAKAGLKEERISAVVSRGGLMKPLPAGVYEINEKMCRDLAEEKYGSHPSSLGPLLAYSLAGKYNCPALTVDPPSTDELEQVARFSGTPLIERKSAFHALSQKGAARYVSSLLGIEYEEGNFIVAHMGGGITVGAHLKGRVVDATHGLSEGPFTPERAGSLPTLELLELFLSRVENVLKGNFQEAQLLERDNVLEMIAKIKAEIQLELVGNGGLKAYLGTKDVREVENKIENGFEEGKLLLKAMGYQIAKEICAMAAVLNGEIDAVVLTGALAKSATVRKEVENRVAFLAPLYVVPENEMQALALGALRVLRGEEKAKVY